MLVAVTLSGVALAVVFRGAEAPAETDQYPMRAINRAIFADERLWMMSDDGSLLYIGPNDRNPQSAKIGGKAVEICKSNGNLTAIIQADNQHWSASTRSSAGWVKGAVIPIESENLVALACTEEATAIAIVTNRRLIEIDGAAVRTVKLSSELQPSFGIGTALMTPDTIWVGLNAGEWGGGLRRIKRGEGKVEAIEKNQSGELCGGPLNANCDPVNGIVASPWRPSCVIAAVGLVHRASHGRIVEVCDKTIRRLYFKPDDPQSPYGKPQDGEPANTIAFFGLIRVGGGVWGLGTDGLYRFDGSPSPQFHPLPAFENRDGYRVSFGVPGVVLVMTDVNQRRSMSGAVPIMAVR